MSKDHLLSYKRYASLAITIGIVLMLIISGPAGAVKVGISGLDGTSSTKGDTITFDVSATIEDADSYVPIENLSLAFTGATEKQVVFSIDGNIIDGGNGINVERTSSSYSSDYGYGYGYGSDDVGYGYGFGYGYGYGYGYGAGGENLTYEYEITLDTSILNVGTHDATLYLNTDDDAKPSFSSSSATFEIKEASTGASTGGGGSSGSMGGGSTGEAFENVVSKHAQIQKVFAGSNVRYDFNDEDSDVSFIQFKGTTNSGNILVTIEVLEGTSTLVDEDAPGQVYRNLNIWVGNAAFDDDNMEDPVVGFRVSKDWMSDNGVDPASIALFHHKDGWDQLETSQTDEDSDYFYFEAETTGFSPFAISTVESSATQTDDTSGDTQADNTDESTDTQQQDSTGSDDDSNDIPALTIVGIIGLIALVGIGVAYSMKKKNS
jgi:PGF-pre-PGF domain-containing protein